MRSILQRRLLFDVWGGMSTIHLRFLGPSGTLPQWLLTVFSHLSVDVEVIHDFFPDVTAFQTKPVLVTFYHCNKLPEK